jgi:DNA-binding transcriptional ArsR family regulator
MALNTVFKALSNATRREILNLLQKGDMSAGDIAKYFDITRPSISHHLNILKQANLVQDVRQGQNIFYSLNTTVFQEVISWCYNILGITQESRGDYIIPEEENPVESGLKPVDKEGNDYGKKG